MAEQDKGSFTSRGTVTLSASPDTNKVTLAGGDLAKRIEVVVVTEASGNPDIWVTADGTTPTAGTSEEEYLPGYKGQAVEVKPVRNAQGNAEVRFLSTGTHKVHVREVE